MSLTISQAIEQGIIEAFTPYEHLASQVYHIGGGL